MVEATGKITNPSSVALKEHFEKQLEGQRVYFEARLAALEKATDLAAGTLKDRLSTMNEFREQLRDQATRFVTREEMEIQVDKLCQDVDELQTFRDRLDGKASQQSVIAATLLGIAGLVLGTVGLIMELI